MKFELGKESRDLLEGLAEELATLKEEIKKLHEALFGER